jgi:hypothetical protein
MKIDLTKYTGYYCKSEVDNWHSYDVIVLIRPQWWIPDKKLKFRRCVEDTRGEDLVINNKLLRQGEWKRINHTSEHFIEALRYVKKHFN